jgi:hypothetical protein
MNHRKYGRTPVAAWTAAGLLLGGFGIWYALPSLLLAAMPTTVGHYDEADRGPGIARRVAALGPRSVGPTIRFVRRARLGVGTRHASNVLRELGPPARAALTAEIEEAERRAIAAAAGGKASEEARAREAAAKLMVAYAQAYGDFRHLPRFLRLTRDAGTPGRTAATHLWSALRDAYEDVPPLYLLPRAGDGEVNRINPEFVRWLNERDDAA